MGEIGNLPVFRFSARWQGLGLRLLGWGHEQELADVNGKRRRQPVQKINRSAETLLLNAANRRAVHLSIDGKVFLAHALFGPDTAKIPSDAGTSLHGPHATNLSRFKPSYIFYILRFLLVTHSQYGRSLGELPMRLFVRSSAAASILALALIVIAPGTTGAAAQTATSQTSAVANLEALTGWWRYDYNESGCDDEDGQYRAALGRYEINSDRELVAGTGPLRFGFYDGECELVEPLFRDGKLEMVAICTSEGEAFNGRATIEALGQDSIAITGPTINSTLIACDPGQARGITAIAVNRGPAAPPAGSASSTTALDIGMPPPATDPDALKALGIEVGETQAPAPEAPSSIVKGWWRIAGGPDCDAMSNGDRITIEPFEIDPSGSIAFGGNKLMTSSAACELAAFVETPGGLNATATCRDQIGEVSGVATFQQDGPNALEVSSPIISGSLLACFNDPASVQADAGPIAQPVPQPTPPSAPAAAETPIVELSHLNPQRNAVVRVIAEYCEPDFYERAHWGDGQWDPEFYRRYQQQFFFRYNSDCAAFKREEYQAFTVIDEMLSRYPTLFPPGAATLSAEQAVLVGFQLERPILSRLEQCDVNPRDAARHAALSDVLEAFIPALTSGDQFTVAAGYFGSRRMSQASMGPMDAAMTPCQRTEFELNTLHTIALGAGIR